jgi:hypothetical protein
MIEVGTIHFIGRESNCEISIKYFNGKLHHALNGDRIAIFENFQRDSM